MKVSNQFNSKQFKALKDKWYKKLEKSGFEDAEKDENSLKSWHSYIFVVEDDTTFQESKKTYYSMAGKFFHDYVFKSKKDKAIWELHSEGISIRNINKTLKKRGFKIYQLYVQSTIKKLVKEMKTMYE